LSFTLDDDDDDDDQIRSDIGLLRVDKRNSTIESKNDTHNNVE